MHRESRQPLTNLRPRVEDDGPFLRRLYASTRLEELSAFGWDDNQVSLFLDSQFEAQDLHYRQKFPGAEFDIILSEGEAIGRLYVQRTENLTELIDIALLPEWRNRGIGGDLLRQILSEGNPVQLHVLSSNQAAKRLYARLGFKEESADGIYQKLLWRPRVE